MMTTNSQRWQRQTRQIDGGMSSQWLAVCHTRVFLRSSSTLLPRSAIISVCVCVRALEWIITVHCCLPFTWMSPHPRIPASLTADAAADAVNARPAESDSQPVVNLDHSHLHTHTHTHAYTRTHEQAVCVMCSEPLTAMASCRHGNNTIH